MAAGEPGDAVPRRRHAAAAGDARSSAQRRRGRGLPARRSPTRCTWPGRVSSRCSCRPGPTTPPCRPTGRRGRCSSGGSARCSRCGRPTTSSSAERQDSLVRRIPGAAGQPHQTFSPAGHFIQDDVGEQLAAAMVVVAEGCQAAGERGQHVAGAERAVVHRAGDRPASRRASPSPPSRSPPAARAGCAAAGSTRPRR